MVSILCAAVSTRGNSIFVPGLLDLQTYGGVSDPGMGHYRPRVAMALFSRPHQSAIARWGWSFHTVREGINLGDHCFLLRVDRVVDVRKDFRSGDASLSSPV